MLRIGLTMSSETPTSRKARRVVGQAFCRDCGTQIDGARFCPACGTPSAGVPADPANTVVLPDVGSAVPRQRQASEPYPAEPDMYGMTTASSPQPPESSATNHTRLVI